MRAGTTKVWAALGLVVLTSLPGLAGAHQGGLLMAMEGQVHARTVNSPQWHPAALRTLYGPGDAVQTGRRSRAEIQFADGTLTRMAALSILQIPAQRTDSFVRVFFGRLWLKVTKQHAPMAIKTPSAVATVVGTELIVSVDGEEVSQVACLEGRVEVQAAGGGPVTVLKPGESTTVRPGGQPEKAVPVNIQQVRTADVLFKPVIQAKANSDQDPDGYSTLLRNLGHETLPAFAPPPVAAPSGAAPDETIIPETAPTEGRSDL